MTENQTDTPAQTLRISHRNVATGELTVEVPGDFTIITVQQRGDFTYVVLKPDPTGESAQIEMQKNLAELNAQTAEPTADASDEPVVEPPVEKDAAGGLEVSAPLPEDAPRP